MWKIDKIIVINNISKNLINPFGFYFVKTFSSLNYPTDNDI